MKRRVWLGEEKTAIVLEMTNRDESMDVCCSRHGVKVSQTDRWQEQFLAGRRAVLVVMRGSKGHGPLEDQSAV